MLKREETKDGRKFCRGMGTSSQVYVWGFSGGKIARISQELPWLLRSRPHRVFIQCGGNDLVKPVGAVEVADRLLALATRMQGFGVKNVFIGSLLPRETIMAKGVDGDYTVDEYKDQILLLNAELKTRCDRSEGVWFWVNRGLDLPHTRQPEKGAPPKDGGDGVHLNRTADHKLYHCICMGLNRDLSHTVRYRENRKSKKSKTQKRLAAEKLQSVGEL